MIDLAPCPSCHRHVRIDEAMCPFCAGVLPAVEPRIIGRGGRLTRAAVFAGASLLTTAAAGCGGKAKPVDDNVVGNTAIDAGPGETPVPIDAEPEGYKNPYDDHPVDMPYGAPPVRERLV